MSNRLLSPPVHGFRRWYSLLAGIAWWMVHLVAEAALVPLACGSRGWLAAMHGVTLITALGTLVAIGWSVQLTRSSGGADDHHVGAQGRDRFLGIFGIAIGGISLLLILWEGAYVAVINACSRY